MKKVDWVAIWIGLVRIVHFSGAKGEANVEMGLWVLNDGDFFDVAFCDVVGNEESRCHGVQ